MTAGPPTAPDGPASVARLIDRLTPASPPTSAAGAAVLIVLRPRGPSVETLLIERAHRVGDPGSGQVGLPGGHVDTADRALVETALREAEEEVGVARQHLTATPRYFTTEYASAMGLHVGVFAAELAGHAPPPTVRDPGEVASFYWLRASALADVHPVRRETRLGPRDVDAVVQDGHVLWGFTLRVLREFFAAELPRTGAA